MENNILLLLPISTKVNEDKSKLKQSKRKQQYIDGIKRVLEYSKIKQFDIVLVDNTTTEKDSEIEEIMPNVSEYIAIDKNENGQRNIGAGILDVWEYLKDDIKTYDWIIHYEPRQYMKDFRIFDMFLEAPKNIFLYGNGQKNHYYTGLFTLNTKELLQYISRVNSNTLVRKRIGLEYSMFTFIKNVEIVDKMGIRWHDRAKDRYVDL